MKALLLLALYLCPLTESQAADTTPVHRETVRTLAAHLVATSATLKDFAVSKNYREAAGRIEEIELAARRMEEMASLRHGSAYWAARHLNEVIHYYARAREAIVREADDADADFVRGNLSSVILNLIREFDEAPNVRHVLGMNDGFGFLPHRTYVWAE